MSSTVDPYAFELSQEEKKTETKKKTQAPAKRGRKAAAKSKTPSKPQAAKDVNESKSSRTTSPKSRPSRSVVQQSDSSSSESEQESQESQEQSSFDASSVSASLDDDSEVSIVDAPAATRSTRSTRSVPSEQKVSPARRSSRHSESAPHDSSAQVSPHQSSRKRARTEPDPSHRHSSPHKPSAAAASSSTSGLFAPRFARDANAHHTLASRTVLDELVLRFLMLGGKLSSSGRKSIDLKGCRTVPDLLDRYSFDELTPYLELHVILNPHLEKEVGELTFEQKLKAVSDSSECKTVSELMDGLVKRYLLIGGDGGRELTTVGRSIRESTSLRSLLEQQNIEDLLPLMSIHAHIHPELGQEAALMSITDKLYYFCADT